MRGLPGFIIRSAIASAVISGAVEGCRRFGPGISREIKKAGVLGAISRRFGRVTRRGGIQIIGATSRQMAEVWGILREADITDATVRISAGRVSISKNVPAGIQQRIRNVISAC